MRLKKKIEEDIKNRREKLSKEKRMRNMFDSQAPTKHGQHGQMIEIHHGNASKLNPAKFPEMHPHYLDGEVSQALIVASKQDKKKNTLLNSSTLGGELG